ncbi:gamma-butyrobetaine hydroxylase-like domain-containing protein [Permianibacter aggregans]|uniref:DUF971 family protein n=1 Tax=Permianibacter aggregans TaxID=1510150 RepID=A0A4R6UPE8_9GAMM|nr:DUF971 domain-containing protein [Permianibacter aggregans]QGX40105.1 DUF971 domain-containing protein [Permianibacter aggregans]TDQ49080.1 DUF971 family protein [Permianibacter aggregans]
MTPTDVKLLKASNNLQLRYASGEQFDLPAEYLRVHSPSAEVRGHGAAEPKLVFGKADVGIRTIAPVGHYALKIVFDDGHDTGLYTWTYLYELGRDQAEKWQAYLARLEREGKSRQPKPKPNPSGPAFTELK